MNPLQLQRFGTLYSSGLRQVGIRKTGKTVTNPDIKYGLFDKSRSSVPGLALASVERSAIDVPRRSLGVQYLAGQGKEKMDQEHLDLTLKVALHSLLLEWNRGPSLTGDGSGMDRNGALEPQTDSLYLRPFEYGP